MLTNAEPTDTRPARTEALMGEVYRWQKKLDQAEHCYSNAVVLAEAAARTNLSAAIPEFESLANFYTYTRPKPEKVVGIYSRILQIMEQTPGTPPDEIAFRARNLADAHVQSQQFAQAEPLYQRALALEEKAGGEVKQYYLALAEFYEKWGKGGEAERYANRALQIAEKGEGIDGDLDRAVCLDRVAAACLMQQKYDDAETACRKAISLIEKIGGSQTTDLIPRLTKLSEILSSRGNLQAAETQSGRALALAEKGFGTNALETAEVLEKRAEILLQLKYTDAAKACSTRAATIRKEAKLE